VFNNVFFLFKKKKKRRRRKEMDHIDWFDLNLLSSTRKKLTSSIEAAEADVQLHFFGRVKNALKVSQVKKLFCFYYSLDNVQFMSVKFV
jgi:hypothetical protein